MIERLERPVEAVLRDPTHYRSYTRERSPMRPHQTDVWHVARLDGTRTGCGRPANPSTRRSDIWEIPQKQRCMRAGCAVRWPPVPTDDASEQEQNPQAIYAVPAWQLRDYIDEITRLEADKAQLLEAMVEIVRASPYDSRAQGIAAAAVKKVSDESRKTTARTNG